MNFSNYSSHHHGMDDLSFHKVMLSTSIMGAVMDILLIVIILGAKAKLLRTEFNILLNVNVLSFLFSALSIVTFVAMFFDLNGFFFQMQCFVIYFGDFLIVFLMNLIILYYSLFHVSFLSRSKPILKLNEFMRNAKWFGVYFVLVLIVSTGLTIGLAFLVYHETVAIVGYHLCNDATNNVKLNALLLVLIIPLFVAILVYSFAAVYIVCTRLTNKQKYLNANEHIRFKRNLLLIFKFLLFNFLSFLKSAPLSFVAIEILFCEYCNIFEIRKWIYCALISYVLQPFLLLFIQNILKNELKQLLNKFIGHN